MVNQNRKYKMVEKIDKTMLNIKDKTIIIPGLVFKPETDDIREVPLYLIYEIYIPKKLKKKRMVLDIFLWGDNINEKI